MVVAGVLELKVRNAPENDIDPRSQAESEGRLIELERQVRVVETVLTSIRDFAYTFDHDGRFVYVNKPLLDLWGLELGDAVGRNFYDLKYPDELAGKLQRQVQQVFDTAMPLSDVTEYTSPNGTAGYYEYIFMPVWAADGSVEFVAGSTRDITAHHGAFEGLQRSEERIRISEGRFRQLADAMPQIVWTAQPDGSLDYYNRRWFEYVNLSPDAADEARWDRFIHPEDIGRAHDAWTKALQTGKQYQIEFRVKRADGQYRWFLVRALPISDDQGSIARWYGTCTDIEDQKELQEQREHLLEAERAARAAAEHASRMKDEFLATLSHELRTPLNAILGWAQLLKGDATDREDLQQGLETIERNARVQTELIEDLLDMSRIISGKLHLEVKSLDPVAFVDAAIETVGPAAAGKRIQIEKHVEPMAGPVWGDAARLQQVVWNLLSNAIKFTPEGGSVMVNVARVNSNLEIRVADSGKGIDPSFLPYVFDRFRQEDSSMSRKHNGLGLGLAIVKQLVELHGGTVGVNSAGESKGTTFQVNLPTQRTDNAPDESPPANSQAVRSVPTGIERANLSGLRVLVVDDEADACKLLKRMLEECSAQVVTAGSAAEGISMLKAHQPHVLVSDIGMPDVDGYEFLRRVRSLPTETGEPIAAIALTAFARSEDRSRALAAGFSAHVSKPVEPSELIATIAGLAAKIKRGELDS